MMTVAIVFLWWLAGAASLLWLRRGDDITWGDLLIAAIVGCFGPFLWVVIIIVVLSQAQFWSRPIFTRKLGGD